MAITPPIVTGFSLTLESSNSARLKFKTTNCNFTWELKYGGTTGARLASSSGLYGKSVNVEVPIKENLQGVYYLIVKGTSGDCNGISTTLNSTLDSRLPVIQTFKITPESITFAKLEINVSPTTYQWRIKHPDGRYTSWSPDASPGIIVNAGLAVSAVDGTYTLEVRRSSAKMLTASKRVRCNTVPPKITNANLRYVSSKELKLTFVSDCDCEWGLVDQLNQSAFCWGESKANTEVIQSVPIDRTNSTISASLVVNRKGYPGLRTIIHFSSMDNSPPVINIESVRTYGDTITVTVSSDSECNSWYFSLLNERGKHIKGMDHLITSGIKKITTTIKDVPIDVPFKVKVSATKVVNQIEGIVSTAEFFTCHASVNLFVTTTGSELGKYCKAVPYIYSKDNLTGLSTWKPAIACIHSNNKWQQLTINE